MNNSSSTRALADSSKATTGLAIAVFLFSLGLAGYVARWAWLNIQADHPIEYRENAVLFTSDFLVHGHNPYLLRDRPVYVNGFGMGYYWVTYPFTRLGGNSYQILRTVSLLFVVAACALLTWVMRVDKTPWLFAIAAALVLFSQLGQGLSIVARPDGFGLFLLMASLVIPYRFGFNSISLAVAAALSILGYLTKAYFLIGIPVLFCYVFLFESKFRALVFAASSAVAFVIVMFLMDRAYECYLTDTFFAARAGASRSWEHLAEHGSTFLLMNFWFVFILLARFLVRDSNTKTERPHWKFQWLELRRPLLSTKASFPGVILLLHALALIFVLGLHLGNDVLYYHQLASPFLLWLAFWLAAVKFRGRWAFTLALLINIAAFVGAAKPLRKEDPAAWQMVEREISMRTNVFTSPHLSHLLYRRGAPVYDAGHTETIRGAFDRNFTRVNEAYRSKADAFFEDIRMQVRNKNFDAVIVLRDWGPMLSFDELQQYYVRGTPLSAPMTFDYWLDKRPLEVWVPRDR